MLLLVIYKQQIVVPTHSIGKPTNNQLNVQVINNYNNGLLYNTDINGNIQADMTSWILFLEFIPIPNESTHNFTI